MAKLQTKYLCGECGASYPRWSGRCEQCGSWNSLTEEITEIGVAHKIKSARPAKVVKLSDIKDVSCQRITTGISEFDQVLGGGIVPGSLILLGGDPGIGKSTLILETAAKIGDVLYVSGEESERQIQLRANRLGVTTDLALLSETNIDTVIATVLVASPKVAIIDSIQTMYSNDLPGTPGSISQVSLCASKLMAVAKENHIAIIVIGHVTKEGALAGPRVLEHLVDVVLYLEGDRFGSFRILRGVKNRFGSTNETGVFEMVETGLVPVANPSEMMIAERAHKSPGSVIFPAMEGSRPLLVEIQALSSSTTFGYPKRTSSGFDLNRLQLLAAVLNKKCGLNLSTQDVYLNIAGGMSVREPAADLAVCIAVASVFKNKPVSETMIIFGEVGLAGEVRSVNNIEKRLTEAVKMGFTEAVIPKTRSSARSKVEGLKIIEVSNVREAIEKAL